MTSTHNKSILLADDDEDDCSLFQDALSEVSTQSQLQKVNTCRQLMEILGKPASHSPGVIILDLNMPGKNGFECLDDLKLIDSLKNIPVIIFSTSSQQETIDRVYEKGAHYYITKPCSFEKLKRIVSKVVGMDFLHFSEQPSREEFYLKF